MILKRDRHEELIAKTREAGAKVRLIEDGDVAGVIACSSKDTKIDIYMGTGGAPEGVLAAAALKVIGGQMMGRLIFNDNQKQIERAKKMGITDLNKKYQANEMAKGDVIFACAGVTDGYMLKGVSKENGKIFVNSLIMDSVAKKVIRTVSEIL
jgi:fructose-1,6-bisphosphatase II / sedoheptulose-1,7-bisphosphatase